MTLDSIVYSIKQRHPTAFSGLASVSRVATFLRHAHARRLALAHGEIPGTVQGTSAAIRPLQTGDLEAFSRFLSTLPDSHFEYFHPHGFTEPALRSVLESSAHACYGVFVHGEMIAYCLLKLFPTRNAYGGLIVSPRFTGLGMGKYLWRYLIWQSCLMRVKPHSTIHADNLASLGSLRSVQPDIVLSPLPGGYQRIEIPVSCSSVQPPELKL